MNVNGKLHWPQLHVCWSVATSKETNNLGWSPNLLIKDCSLEPHPVTSVSDATDLKLLK